MTRITFSIPGQPRGKDRARASARVVDGDDGPEAFVRMHTTKQTADAEAEILAIFRKQFPHHKPWTGAVLIRFTAVFAIPRSFNKALRDAAARGQLYCIAKPDKDNIEKLITDALTPPKRKRSDLVPPTAQGYAWADDAQLMGGGIKRYGSPARTDVTLELLATPDSPVTPGEKRTKARMAAPQQPRAVKAVCPTPTKSGKSRLPAGLQQRIDAALARDARKPGRS